MLPISLDLISGYWPIAIVAVLLAVILVGFPLRFIWPAVQLGSELSQATSALKAIKDISTGSPIDLHAIARDAMPSPRLAHLWNEFAQTLRPERREDEHGQLQIIRWRAPALAETFFGEQALVDIPLKTDFYKHLPGILTGLGIIGTFSGLIIGLGNFDVSVPATEVPKQLDGLVKSVGHAFIVSAIAIAMAMLFTWLEKSVVTARYRQVEELRQIIDSLFGASAGEEHLERIAAASETSATQALQIKDALVADLRQLLDNQSVRAAEIATQNARQMSSDISQALSDRLAEPITEIAHAVKAVSISQGEAVNKMLTDVLASFSEQMERMFGGQIRGMSDLLQRTTQAMSETAQQFERLAGGMGAAGKEAVDAMGERLNHAISSLEAGSIPFL